MKNIFKRASNKSRDEREVMVKNCLDDGLEARKPFEQQWIIELAFLNGQQYTFFNRNAYMLQSINPVRGRIRNVDNKLLPRWRRQVADLIKNNPSMGVVPETAEDEDIKSAKTGDKVLKSLWRTLQMKKKIRELAGWMFSTGNGFLDDRWNPRLGPTYMDEAGVLRYMGDVDASVWSPFEICVPFMKLGATNIHRFPWLIKMKWHDLDWIVSNYGAKGKKVPNENLKGTPFVETGVLFSTPNMPNQDKVEGALVVDFYLQPNDKYKKGLFCTVANGVVLQHADYPFLHYHMSHFKDIDTPGVFWGKATTSEAIPLQKMWNRTISSIDEYNRTMAKGKGMVPRGAKLETLPDNTHGEWIEYTPVLGHAPKHLDLKGLPRTYDQILQYAHGSLNDLYSKHEVSQGSNKSDIRSGDMVDLLLEQDAHGNIPSHACFEESLEEWASRILKRVQKGYTAERMIKVIGREGDYEVQAFKGSDLRNNTDVSVKRQSSMPDSRAMRRRNIMEAYKAGLYGDPTSEKVRREVMNMLDEAVSEDKFRDTRHDEAYARWENRILSDPKIDAYLVNNYDNHQIHVEEHNFFRKSMDFQKIKLQDQQAFITVDSKFHMHIAQHQKFLQAARDQMLKEQAMLKGGLN